MFVVEHTAAGRDGRAVAGKDTPALASLQRLLQRSMMSVAESDWRDASALSDWRAAVERACCKGLGDTMCSTSCLLTSYGEALFCMVLSPHSQCEIPPATHQPH